MQDSSRIKSEGGEEERGTRQERQANARGKARGMVLRWALLKAMGPDRWHFAAILNQVSYAMGRCTRSAILTMHRATRKDTTRSTLQSAGCATLSAYARALRCVGLT